MRVVGIAQPCPSSLRGYGAGLRDEVLLWHEQLPPNEQHVEQRWIPKQSAFRWFQPPLWGAIRIWHRWP